MSGLPASFSSVERMISGIVPCEYNFLWVSAGSSQNIVVGRRRIKVMKMKNCFIFELDR
jgi:hypothetical protein